MKMTPEQLKEQAKLKECAVHLVDLTNDKFNDILNNNFEVKSMKHYESLENQLVQKTIIELASQFGLSVSMARK
jgi:hypothetical protein